MESYDLFYYEDIDIHNNLDGEYIKTADFKKVMRFIKFESMACIGEYKISYVCNDCEDVKLCRYFKKLKI